MFETIISALLISAFACGNPECAGALANSSTNVNSANIGPPTVDRVWPVIHEWSGHPSRRYFHRLPLMAEHVRSRCSSRRRNAAIPRCGQPSSLASLISSPFGTSGDPTDFRIYRPQDGGITWTYSS